MSLCHEFGQLLDSVVLVGVFRVESEHEQLLLRVLWPLHQQTKRIEEVCEKMGKGVMYMYMCLVWLGGLLYLSSLFEKLVC